MNERPIAFCAFFFVSGIALCYYLSLPFAPLLAGALCSAGLFLLLLLAGKKICMALFYASVFFAGALLFCAQYPVDFSGIDPRAEYVIEGRVSDRQPGEYSRYTLSDVSLSDVRQSDGRETVAFKEKVYLYSIEALDYGDVISFKSRVEPPDTSRNPRALDERMYLASQNVGFSCFAHEVNVLDSKPGPYGPFLRMRELLAERIDLYFTPDTAPVAKAMLLGIKSELPEELRAEYSGTGIAHVLSISGLHIAILAAALLFALKKLKVKRKTRLFAVVLVLAFYALLTGLAPSVVRAVLMTVFVTVGRWHFSDRDPLTFLCAAMMTTLILFGTPLLFMPGFLMSYGAVFGLLCLLPAMNRLFGRIRFRGFAASTVSASLAAGIAVFPLTAYYFGSVSLAAPIANFYAVPLTVAIVILSALFSLFGFLPPAAAAFAFVSQAAVALLNAANASLARTGFGYLPVDRFPVWAGIAVFAVLFLCSDYVFVRRRWKAVLSAALVGAVALALCLPAAARTGALRVTVLDVGTGDAVHIRTETGDYLIDNGGNMQRSRLEDYTKNGNITYDKVIVTNDRTNNLRALAEDGRIGVLATPENYVPKDWDENLTLEHYALYDKIDLGGGVFAEVVADDGKNLSIALGRNGEYLCLLAQNDAEDLVGFARAVPVVKLSGGGGEGCVSREFLDALAPKIAVISAKEDGKRALPAPQTLAALAEKGVTVYRTAERGAVTLVWTGGEMSEVETMK